MNDVVFYNIGSSDRHKKDNMVYWLFADVWHTVRSQFHRFSLFFWSNFIIELIIGEMANSEDTHTELSTDQFIDIIKTN